jgi:hypothetical protein
MNFTRLGLNLVSNFYLNRVYIVSRHVAASEWWVPVRLDLDCEPSDLKGYERPGLVDTLSLSGLF